MVALGRGSSIDTAKAIGIISNNPEFADVRSPEGTASTGMDSLTHAIESFITPGTWTMSDMFEYKAIELTSICTMQFRTDGMFRLVKEWQSLSEIGVA